MEFKKHIPKILLALIILASAGLMVGAAISDSPAIGETQNILGIFGNKFAQSSNDLYIARGLAVLASIIFLLLLYVWSAKLIGTRWALLPVFMLALSPSFLAYGHYFNLELLNIFALLIFGYVFVRILMNIKTLLRTKSYRELSLYIIAALLLIALFYFHGGESFSGASKSGNWIDLAINYSLKEATPLLALIIIAFIFATKNVIKKIPEAKNGIANYFLVNPAEFSIIIFLPIYILLLVMQAKTQLLYILPTLPLVYILTSSGIKNFLSQSNNKNIKVAGLIIFASWHTANAFISYPYYSAYTNEIVKVNKTLEYAMAAKYDMGIDLKRLNEWLLENPGKIGLDYYGDADPKDYLGDQYIEWQSSYNEPAEVKLDYIAISFKKIYEAKRELAPQEARNAEDEYLWLPNIFRPDYKVGSIWIYKLSPTPTETSEF